MATGSDELGTTIDIGGVPTNYHDQGEGRVVLMLHGSGPGVTAWANWRLVIPEFAKDFRVVAPDLAGFGYSLPPNGFEYNVETWRDHIVGFLDRLEIDKFSVIGNSFGGAMALRLATTIPDRVESIVLMGSGGVDFTLTEGLDAVWGYEPSIEAMREILDIFAYDRTRVTDELARLRYEASIRPGVQEAYAAMFPAPRQRWVDALAVDNETISEITCPALIVHGREDLVVPPSNAPKLFELIPRAQLHMFGQCGHWTQIEQTERFVNLVRDFLQESAD
ncbi:alpha/beta fold hydrolase [Rhodococcus opacus]|uniref:alpha/beta fold hydrolase n=1 Tax=Rhodococcus opacus TaxID=37919 RepID=UPI002474427F|nr:alpha/beta hydrolase [Rhodococcus opacus]MDH6288239.1 2-hydroxymuconate-semialdehyde hydrolase [Rhodococcus opacus]